MYAFDYDAVIYDSAIHCLSCLPENVTEKDYEPIFADSEWDEYPTCDCCGKIHDYVKLIVRNNQKWCIMKVSRHQENPSPYAGPAANNAGIIPRYYSDKNQAIKDAKILSEYNPVRFSVVKAKKLNENFPVE